MLSPKKGASDKNSRPAYVHLQKKKVKALKQHPLVVDFDSVESVGCTARVWLQLTN